MKFKDVEKGSVRDVIAIALPMVISFSCDTVMIFTDRLFLAKLGPVHMNAAMAGGLSAWMMMGFLLGLAGYTTALAAQYLGAQQKKKCPVVLTQAVFMIALGYPVIVLCRPLAHAFFEGMGVSAAQLGPQKEYFDILVLGAAAALARHALSSFFSGIGRTAVVMAASLIAMAVNVVLGYVFIYGKFGLPALGMQGAAYASILGSVSGVLVLAARYFSPSLASEFAVFKSLYFDREVFSKLWRFGFPPGLEMFLNILGFNTMVLLFHSTGEIGATASTIVLNWDMVSFVPLLGVEIGVTSLVGRYMGAREPGLAHRSTMSGIKFGLSYSAVVFVLFAGFPELLVRVFSPGESRVFSDAVPLAVRMLRLASLYVLLQAMMVALVGALRGAGDTLWAMWIMVGAHWVIVVILYLMLKVFGLTPMAGWIALIAVFFAFSGLVLKRYTGGKWQQIRLVAGS